MAADTDSISTKLLLIIIDFAKLEFILFTIKYVFHFHPSLDKYEVDVAETLRTKFLEIDERWEWYTDIIGQCQKMIESSKDNFRVGLLESAEKFKQDAVDLLDIFTVIS